MWLAIIWLLSDYLGHSDALGYRPRGVHRPSRCLSSAVRGGPQYRSSGEPAAGIEAVAHPAGVLGEEDLGREFAAGW